MDSKTIVGSQFIHGETVRLNQPG